MDKKERLIIAAILFIISITTLVDIFADISEGSSVWHVATEGVIAIISSISVFYVLSGTFALKRSLEEEKKLSSKLQSDLVSWKESSKKYIEGLSQSIDQQLENWKLTTSEKEVAFLLLKGLSLKEIAEVRNTSEKTTRAQSTSIYNKAGLSGRSQLSAHRAWG